MYAVCAVVAAASFSRRAHLEGDLIPKLVLAMEAVSCTILCLSFAGGTVLLRGETTKD